MKRDHLDEAIDATAARMTAVTDDDSLAIRIVSSLPERSAWSLHWLMPGLVGLAIIIIVVLGPFDGRSTEVPRTESSPVVSPSIVEPRVNDRRTSVETPVIVRRTIVERPLNDRRTTSEVERPDHERSLAAIAAPEALGLGSLVPASLPEDAPLTIESLEIADLPLTADFSPRW